MDEKLKEKIKVSNEVMEDLEAAIEADLGVGKKVNQSFDTSAVRAGRLANLEKKRESVQIENVNLFNLKNGKQVYQKVVKSKDKVVVNDSKFMKENQMKIIKTKSRVASGYQSNYNSIMLPVNPKEEK